jgi:hypothetical protein
MTEQGSIIWAPFIAIAACCWSVITCCPHVHPCHCHHTRSFSVVATGHSSSRGGRVRVLVVVAVLVWWQIGHVEVLLVGINS